MSQPIVTVVPSTNTPEGDSIICYCHGRTLGELVNCHNRVGSLAAVQRETRAGSSCGGCRVTLEALFQETPGEILDLQTIGQSLKMLPGQRLMAVFVASDGQLETKLYSSNAAPPQFGAQETGMDVEYAMIDRDGAPVLRGKRVLKTNETFHLDTREMELPRPFYGMLVYAIGRFNYGASRINAVWFNSVSASSTHEVYNSGRPSVVIPIPADREFLRGPNTIYLAMHNPYPHPLNCVFRCYDLRREQPEILARLDLQSRHTRWINVNAALYQPLLENSAAERIAVRVESDPIKLSLAPTLYMFVHNRNSGIWNANHL